MRLVLASSSPRRSFLLTAAGFELESRAPNVDESLLENEAPADATLRLADLKAHAVARASNEVVLAADTMVVLNGTPFGKPAGISDATEMLSKLSGRTHSVLTGWMAVSDTGERFGIAETRVTFKQLSAEGIHDYITDTQPFDKAGAYGIQGENGRLIDHFVGSRANVMGLPLRDVSDALSELGIERSAPHR